MASYPDGDCLPSPITNAILRRVLCELPIGTSRAVESCIHSYRTRFMSTQDILEFLRSVAGMSPTLERVFAEHDRNSGTSQAAPAWELQGSTSPASVNDSPIRGPPGPPTGLGAEDPTALLHGPIPAVTDHSAWSIPDDASIGRLKQLWQREREQAHRRGQPAHFTGRSTAQQPSSSRPREPLQDWPEHALRTLQRSSSPRPALLSSDYPRPAPRLSPPCTLQRSSSPPRHSARQEQPWLPKQQGLERQLQLHHHYHHHFHPELEKQEQRKHPSQLNFEQQEQRKHPSQLNFEQQEQRKHPSQLNFEQQEQRKHPSQLNFEQQEKWKRPSQNTFDHQDQRKHLSQHNFDHEDQRKHSSQLYFDQQERRRQQLQLGALPSELAHIPFKSLWQQAQQQMKSVSDPRLANDDFGREQLHLPAMRLPAHHDDQGPGDDSAEEEEHKPEPPHEAEELQKAPEEEAEGDEEPKLKPKRKRIRLVKPSAPPTEEELAQMARYAARRREEAGRRRAEAARVAMHRALPPQQSRGRKKGADDGKEAAHEPPPPGSEHRPAGMLRYTLLELARHLEREDKVALRQSLAAYTSGRTGPEELAAEIQGLVDARQLVVPLPLSLDRFGALLLNKLMMSKLLAAQGNLGRPRRRKCLRKRAAGLDVNAKCPVCVEQPLTDGRWVKCDGCDTCYHQVCVLYNELANWRKLRFFCRTPQCQKRNSRQLNRRYHKARHPMSPVLPDTPLSLDMAARAAAVARPDRKVVVKEVFGMPREQCLVGDASPKNAEGKCECCRRRTVAGFQHTMTGSDLLFALVFVDEHSPRGGASRATLRGLAVNGLYEEASEGEGLRVEAAILGGYLRDAAQRGITRMEIATAGDAGEAGLISGGDAAECVSRAREVWQRVTADSKTGGVVASVEDGVVSLIRQESKPEAEAEATASKAECPMMESPEKLRAFMASRQYEFATLQMAKYASMMLVYHLDQAMAVAASNPAERANRDGEDDGEEEEEVEDAGEAAASGHSDGASDEEMDGVGGEPHGFEQMGEGLDFRMAAWRKEIGAGSFRGKRGSEIGMLLAQPNAFPLFEDDN